MARRVLIGDLIRDHQKKFEDRGVDIVLEDNVTIRVPAPQLWSDEVLKLGARGDVVGAARALIGDDQFDLLVAAGGNANMLMAIVEDETGATVPE